jgi:hypothetical protein
VIRPINTLSHHLTFVSRRSDIFTVGFDSVIACLLLLSVVVSFKLLSTLFLVSFV